MFLYSRDTIFDVKGVEIMINSIKSIVTLSAILIPSFLCGYFAKCSETERPYLAAFIAWLFIALGAYAIKVFEIEIKGD